MSVSKPEGDISFPDLIDVPEVLAEEHQQIVDRRAKLNVISDIAQNIEAPPSKEAEQFYKAHDLRPFGVCLSGGGIRSATFNLGILQGLTERGLLPLIDYLSTVSGGGYIGTWLHGIIKEPGGGDPRKVKELISPSKNERGASRVPKEPKDADQDPVTFLRKYSNYLAPRLGLFSPDFWVIAVIWIRNMVLNQLILVPFLGGLVLLGIHAGLAQQISSQTGYWRWPAVGAFSFLCLACAVGIMIPNLYGIIKREFGDDSKPSAFEDPRIIWICVVLVLLSALVIGTSSYDPIPKGVTQPSEWVNLPLLFVVLYLLYLSLQLFGGFRKSFKRLHATFGRLWGIHVLWIPPVSAAVTTVLVAEVLHSIRTWSGGLEGAWHTVAWGPPLVVLALMVGVTLQIGLMGADFPDSTREWLSRLGALLAICSAAWMGLFALAVFGPKWFSSFALTYGKTAAGMVGGWIATTAAGLVAGRSSKTDGGDPSKTNGALEWIGKIAPTVFLVGYLLSISFVVHEIIAHWADVYAPSNMQDHAAPPKSSSGAKVDISMPVGSSTGSATLHAEMNTDHNPVPHWLAWLQPIDKQYWKAYAVNATNLESGPLPLTLKLWFACGLLVGILPLRININEFSLHHFYKNRLVRCYLGAGRGNKRRPNPFTGFDHNDDFRIGRLRATEPDVWPEHEWKAYWGPLPIVNTTLNLNAGSELATQERKGASFIFSALRCGFDPPHSVKESGHSNAPVKGYRDTRRFMYGRTKANFGGPLIGTAMGISGAAANPNGGYHTSAPLAFLMTIFDVRLGWWVGNPKKDGPSSRPGPLYALASLLSELFAHTDWHSNYLNLSDGGHFDNLGLYELVRRRCRYIIVGDGEEDGALNFESLGGAIRKCRADFGVEIDLDPKMIHAEGKPSKTHCVVGTVSYPEVRTQAEEFDMCGGKPQKEPGPMKGWILYLKASLTGDEPEDVTQYHASHSEFPHEPTSNQFFTESQFESYRRLGLHVVETAFEGLAGQLQQLGEEPTHARLSILFNKLCQHWYPPTTVADGVSTRHTEAYSALMKRLSDDPDLKYLDAQIILRMTQDELGNCKEAANESQPPWPADRIRKARFFCLDLIQLMENVWADLHLDEKAERDNPKNGGWMRMFRHWASQPIFQETWKETGCTYNDLFREFYSGLCPAAGSGTGCTQQSPAADARE